MGLLRTLKYWLGGGKRRWFARKAKQLPVLAQQGNLLGGALFEALSVGLDVAPDRALGLLLAVDPHATEAYTTQVVETEWQDILRRAARMASGPAWRIGWTIAKRLKQPEHLRTFGRGLALHWAREGDTNALVLHLDDCRDAGLLDRELLGDVVREAHRSVQDDPSWRLCLSCCHEHLGDLFAALRVCPPTQQERRLGLIERVRRAAFEAAERGESSNAMTAVMKLQEILADDPGPAWRIGWSIAKRLAQPEHRKTFGRGLALYWASVRDTNALVMHLDDCRDAGSIDRDLLGDIVRELAAHRGLGDDPGWRLCLSCCHEYLGDLPEALRVCLPTQRERRIGLIVRLEKAALDTAKLGESSNAMTAIMELRRILADEVDPSPAWLDRRGILERHRAELLKLGRQALEGNPPADRRDALLARSAFEELAGEWAQAALLLEQSGELADRLRASQLWEKDERYGEAVRALGTMSDRAEVQLRMAQLRESGGDTAGAAVLFEHLRRWSDARRAHEAAGHWTQAAHCFRQEHGETRAAESLDYGRLLVRGQRVDELLQLYLEQLDKDPSNRVLLDRLRWLIRDNASQIQSQRLRDAATARLATVVDVELRRAFERAAPGWIDQARDEIQKRYGRLWGMDLGTSKSAVAVFDLTRGTAVICPHKGQPHFPSTLGLDKSGNELVGLSALEQLRPDLRGCIEGSKRAIGTRKVYRIGERHFSPEEVAARLLTHGRGLAEAFLRDQVRDRVLALARASLGDNCEADWLEGSTRADKLAFSMPDAVVTIPAYFNFAQRRATRDAAEIAGIKVHRLISEPTAACLSAGLARQLPGRMLVVDLGAGTLDLSYLDATYRHGGESSFDVIQIFGDSQFGSGDFDAVLEKHFVDQLQQAGLDLRPLDRRRLHAATEQIKIALSSSQTATNELVSFAGRDRHTLELTAARLEQLIAPLIDRLEQICRQAASLKMDHLVLVGGPMFSPLIRRRIEQLFGRKADAVVDPRTAVAMGAACQGAVLSNHAQVPFQLLDVVPFALGVLVKPPVGLPMVSFHIPRGTRIPHENRKPYFTTKDNQTSVDVEVFQGLGESTDPAANNQLATFHLDGLPPAKAGEAQIDITFSIDANGLLEVTAKDQKTGNTKSLRIEDVMWLSPSARTDMTQRLAKSQRWARERAELTVLVQQIDTAADKLQALERRDAAQAWQRHFAAWRRIEQSPSSGRLDPRDDALLAEMYNTGQTACDQAQLGIDRARNLRPRCQRFVRAAGELDLSGAEAEVEKQLHDLLDQGRQLDFQSRDTLTTLEPLENGFQRWSAALSRCSALRADPRDRLTIYHDSGDWQRSLDAYHQAFADTPAAEIPTHAIHRHLDGLARLGHRERYRHVLAEQRERLTLHDLQLDKLNEFGRRVLPAIAWVFAQGRGTGSGFLAAPNLVVTNRHVVVESNQAAPPGSVVVHVGGVPRPVTRMRFPANPEIDLVVLELPEQIDSPAVRVGYTSLVEIGDRVVAIGFPLPEGESFEENLLLDHGIVNRIRTRPDRHGRELEVGLRISPGMSGGPVFNDRGEVIAVSTFVRYQSAGQQVLDKSSHAIAVDALHELLPRRW